VVDGSKCISYFTIELRDAIPQEYKGKFENWAFGCDVCQEVCPWNRFSEHHTEPELQANKEMLQMNRSEWMEITREIFEQKFAGSPLQRTGYDGLKKNLEFISKRA
jgi:epoxyqueuosine reductase